MAWESRAFRSVLTVALAILIALAIVRGLSLA
jgi:hypothetical protein